MTDYKEELKQAQKKYDKICNKLEVLNVDATELEKEIMFLKSMQNVK